MKDTERFARLFVFIDANLDADLSLNVLSEVACMSKFHLQRRFKATFGFSLAEYVNALRDKKSGVQLLFRGDSTVLELALEHGYQSSEAFSRAFKQRLGKSPSQFSKCPDWDAWHNLISKLSLMRNQTMPAMHYNVELVELNQLPIAVMEHKGAAKLLGATIQQFIQWRKQHRLAPNKSRTFNLLYSDPRCTPDEHFRFGLAAECHDSRIQLADDMYMMEIPNATFARVKHVGSDEAMQGAVDFLYYQWLEQSDWQLQDFPLLLERVRFYPEATESEAETHIYLPVA